jgi:putative ABC transport system permease protein
MLKGGLAMGNLAQDVRYSIRMLANRPAFTLVATLALALGIGANTAIFSVVNAVLLRPLPYPHPEQLMMLWGVRDDRNHLNASYPDFADFRDQAQTLESVAAYQGAGVLLTGGDEPERLAGAIVSADMFPLLGVSPALGRAFTREEDKPGAPRVVVIGHNLWQRRFSLDPEIIGREITLSARPYTVIGVMPEGFKFPADYSKTEFLLPFAPSNADQLTRRGSHFFYVAARLKPGVTIEEANSDVATISGRLAEAYPETNTKRGAVLVPMHDDLVQDVRLSLLVLIAAVAFVLLIACANVANLLLARAVARQKEIAIRTAVGASRFRIIRQLLTESLLLSTLGGAAGLILALWGVDLLVSASPGSIPRLKEVALDGRVLGFTILVTMLTGLVFGLAPALGASKPDLSKMLKEGGRQGGEGARRASLRKALVISEVAICLMLLIGAGLLIKSFVRLRAINPGFNSDGVVTVFLAPSRASYPQPEQALSFFQQITERAKQTPGVESAALVNLLPLAGSNTAISFTIEGRPALAPGTEPSANYRTISPDYFRVMRMPLLRGRALSDRDTKDTPHVIVINESFAREHFPGEDPIGKRILIGDENPPPREIVGIVGDIRHDALDKEAVSEYYVSCLQNPGRYLYLVARTSLDGAGAALAMRNAIKEVDKNIYVPDVESMEQLLRDSIAGQRFNMLLLGLFAAVALTLAAVGIYGVMSYTVTQRTHEIGVRMALGAQQKDVLKLVVGQGMLLALAGVAIGVGASLFLTELMSSLLYGVSATDPVTFLLISVILTGVALGACYVPARRATKVDPMVALRYE